MAYIPSSVAASFVSYSPPCALHRQVLQAVKLSVQTQNGCKCGLHWKHQWVRFPYIKSTACFNRSLLTRCIAIVVACGPAFAALLRSRSNANKPSYNSQGYIRKTPGKDWINLSNINSEPSDVRERDIPNNDETIRDQGNLEGGDRAITVTTTVHVSGGRSSSQPTLT